MGGTILDTIHRGTGQVLTDDAYGIIPVMNKRKDSQA